MVEHAPESDGGDNEAHRQGCKSRVPGDGRFQRVIEPGRKLPKAVVKGQGVVGDLARDGHRTQQAHDPSAATGKHNDSERGRGAVINSVVAWRGGDVSERTSALVAGSAAVFFLGGLVSLEVRARGAVRSPRSSLSWQLACFARGSGCVLRMTNGLPAVLRDGFSSPHLRKIGTGFSKCLNARRPFLVPGSTLLNDHAVAVRGVVPCRYAKSFEIVQEQRSVESVTSASSLVAIQFLERERSA